MKKTNFLLLLAIFFTVAFTQTSKATTAEKTFPITQKVQCFRPIPITVTGTFYNGICEYTFTFNVVIDWDFNPKHRPKVTSVSLGSYSIDCTGNRGGSCLVNLDAFKFDEETTTFSDLLFSSNCPDVQTDFNAPSATTIMANALGQGINNFVLANGQ